MMILCGYVLALFGGMIGLMIGNYLLTNDATVRGERIYRFDRQTRRHAKAIIALASVVILIGLLLNLSLKT